MKYNYNDGGRRASHNSGGVSDCVTRALSIVSHCGYDIAKAYLAPLMTPEGVDVFAPDFAKLMDAAGLVYVPTLPRTFRVSQLPEVGNYIAHTSRHVSAVVDGVIQDTFDTRDELVQGYWIPKSAKGYDVYENDARINLNPAPLEAAVRMIELYKLNYARDAALTVRPIL